MAKSNRVPLPKKALTPEEIERGISRLGKRIHDLETFDVDTIRGKSGELTPLSASIRDALDRSFGEGTSAFARLEPATDLAFRPMMFSDNYPLPHHYQEHTRTYISRAIELLKVGQQMLREDLEELPSQPQATDESKKRKLDANGSVKVFVVHGHDDAAKQALGRFLERIGLEAVVLSEQPDAGRTIIEKFEACASDVGFAVVLLTPDDVGSAKSDDQAKSRARQNVVFELGYFAGKLGRGRTCLLRKGNVEIPSDLYGVIYVPLDENDGWKRLLARELKAAGLQFDHSKVF